MFHLSHSCQIDFVGFETKRRACLPELKSGLSVLICLQLCQLTVVGSNFLGAQNLKGLAFGAPLPDIREVGPEY